MKEVGYREIEVSPLIPFFMDFQFAPLAGGLITVGTSQGVGKKTGLWSEQRSRAL